MLDLRFRACCHDDDILSWHGAASPQGASCGTDFLPGTGQATWVSARAGTCQHMTAICAHARSATTAWAPAAGYPPSASWRSPPGPAARRIRGRPRRAAVAARGATGGPPRMAGLPPAPSPTETSWWDPVIALSLCNTCCRPGSRSQSFGCEYVQYESTEKNWWIPLYLELYKATYSHPFLSFERESRLLSPCAT